MSDPTENYGLRGVDTLSPWDEMTGYLDELRAEISYIEGSEAAIAALEAAIASNREQLEALEGAAIRAFRRVRRQLTRADAEEPEISEVIELIEDNDYLGAIKAATAHFKTAEEFLKLDSKHANDQRFNICLILDLASRDRIEDAKEILRKMDPRELCSPRRRKDYLRTLVTLMIRSGLHEQVDEAIEVMDACFADDEQFTSVVSVALSYLFGTSDRVRGAHYLDAAIAKRPRSPQLLAYKADLDAGRSFSRRGTGKSFLLVKDTFESGYFRTAIERYLELRKSGLLVDSDCQEKINNMHASIIKALGHSKHPVYCSDGLLLPLRHFSIASSIDMPGSDGALSRFRDTLLKRLMEVFRSASMQEIFKIYELFNAECPSLINDNIRLGLARMLHGRYRTHMTRREFGRADAIVSPLQECHPELLPTEIWGDISDVTKTMS